MNAAQALSMALRAACLVAFGAPLFGCASISRLPTPTPTFSEAPARGGALTRFARLALADDPPGDSAFRLLHDNEDALKVRLALADLAVRTLDIQYFIWQDDATGRLLLQHVIAAADRGVRVRLLLDDLALGGRDRELAELDAHPKIEVRIFNPWTDRSIVARPLQFVVSPGRLNHRMHNKTFVADGRFGILGGRNIGDRYFGVYRRLVQNDLDVLVAGPALQDVEGSFDLYWNSALTVPVYWRGGRDEDGLAALRRACDRDVVANGAELAAFAVPADGWSEYFDRLLDGARRGPAELYVDSPRVDGREPTQLYRDVKELLAQARGEVLLSSPYLIPDRDLVQELAALVARGVRVRILTNSLASNSHVIAHTGYKKWRRALLRAGVELYEMRARPAILEYFVTPPVEADKLALHAKAIVVDGRWTFVGSPNIDPRSMVVNTEVGMAIDSRDFAADVAAIIEQDMRPENAWRVTLDQRGWLHWARGRQRLDREPAEGFGQRAEDFFLNLLPIKNQT